MSLEIYDPTDTKVHTTATYAQNSTASFTYKIPSSASGGEYAIKVYNY